ncbi:MAG: acetyl-CoA carboxylase biotin carboxyl carrier protein [Gammaproteobacteria bacterium]|nr:acetyl-CoA carboxylase biotin carboxyl carrier protein [Gammaproteobacteria bacterium]MDA8021392.1 acetyl-CoA carboxylase biotin carboxyl carrier protein [Gammaproteobacteria bacterium]
MDLRKIKKLIELLEESALNEIEITEGDNTIRLNRARPASSAPPPPAVPVAPVVPAAAAPAAPAPASDAPGDTVVSPLVGTFYDAPSPQDSPYVRIGAEVRKGDTLCLIEAMKTYNQLEAEFAGTVRAIHKNSGDPVEYGEPLFVIERRDG